MRHRETKLDKKLRKAADEVIKTSQEARRILRRTERRERREKRAGGDQHGWQAEPRNQEGPAVEGEQAGPEEEGEVTC